MKCLIVVLVSLLSVFCNAAFSEKDSIIVVSGQETISKDFVISKNQTLRVNPGATIMIEAGVCLTINGRIEAGAFPIFAGEGKVAGAALVEAVYPEWFCNDNDGDGDNVDWGIAINKAVKFANMGCRIVRLQSRRYNVNTVIDLTSSVQEVSAGIKLEGALRSTQSERGTALVGNTGSTKPIIETTDTDGVHLKDLALLAGKKNPSTIGILQARGGSRNWGGDHYYENIYINMRSNPAANSKMGTIGIINLAAEECKYHNLQIWANLPFVSTWTSSFMLTNPELDGTQRTFKFTSACGKTLATNASNTALTFSGMGRLIALDYVAPCILLNCSATVDMGHTFMQMRHSNPSNKSSGKYSYAIENWNNYQFRYFGSLEGAKGFILSRRTFENADISVRIASASGENTLPMILLYDDGGAYVWDNVRINFFSFDTKRPLVEYRRYSNKGGFTLKNCQFRGNISEAKNVELQ